MMQMTLKALIVRFQVGRGW